MNSATTEQTGRLGGLDLARYLAFVGRVIVNFKVVMGAETSGGILAAATGALEGRAAALFVILAGIGLGLAGTKGISQTVGVTVKRAVFLLAIGLLNMLVFDADILHYYAFYFLFGALLLRSGTRLLVAGIVMLNVAFVVLILILNYDTGWNWNNYSYTGFWTPTGFIRNLFFNGWHPVIPWLGFLLFGIILSRTSLARRSVQRKLLFGGVVTAGIAEAFSRFITPRLGALDVELAVFGSTHPVPPMPLYTLAGIGTSSIAIGACLLISGWAQSAGLMRLVVPAGRQTLTLYIAHILVGMWTLEALGMLGGQSIVSATVAALIFSLLATIYAFIWNQKFKRGPIESLMRKVAG
ncbi:transporter [bacterium DOLZORAL124_64_63]|nr:MAG: transporter [bacterium DOLZORAL124_64_63]